MCSESPSTQVVASARMSPASLQCGMTARENIEEKGAILSAGVPGKTTLRTDKGAIYNQTKSKSKPRPSADFFTPNLPNDQTGTQFAVVPSIHTEGGSCSRPRNNFDFHQDCANSQNVFEALVYPTWKPESKNPWMEKRTHSLTLQQVLLCDSWRMVQETPSE